MSEPRPRPFFLHASPAPRKPATDSAATGQRPAEDPLRGHTNASIVAVLLFVVLVVALVVKALYAPAG